MQKVIALLAQAGATGALADISAVSAEAVDAAAAADALGIARHLACYVSAPDNDPSPLDVPVRPDEDEPEAPGTPQAPDVPGSRVA